MRTYYINYWTEDGSHRESPMSVGRNLRIAIREAKELAYSVTKLGSVTDWKVTDSLGLVVAAGVVGYTTDGRKIRFLGC